MKHAHGLVIGKFYPPHQGHHLLIRAAAANCGRVTVIAMAAAHETIALAARVDWLRAAHADAPHVVVTGCADDVPIDYENAAIWEQHVALMREALGAIGAPRVSAVFTAEPYGAELARRFDAHAVTLDTSRSLAPVSASAVRADPVAQWEQLAEPTRAGLALRVVVIGAESTGTTTVSRALADHWRAQGGVHGLTRWVPEYGREYTVQRWADAQAQAQIAGQPAPGLGSLQWRSPEFVHIARTQLAMENAAAAIGGPLLICDTDAFATAIWHERYLEAKSPEVLGIAAHALQAPRLYLLTDDAGVPFVQDGIRDGETLRTWMTQRFATALTADGRAFVRLSGDREQRLQAAIAATQDLLRKGWGFTTPSTAPPAAPRR